jgi:hypothetical protein
VTINQATLRDLYARVAANDGDARRDFDRHVLPLLEVVVARWLSQRRYDAGTTGRNRPMGGLRPTATPQGALLRAERLPARETIVGH